LAESGLGLGKEMLEQVKHDFPEAYHRAKVMNFAVIYGAGPKGYADIAGVSEVEARRSIDGFFRLYPKIQQGIRETQKNCFDRGYVRTILGRYLKIPQIRSQDSATRAYANRQSFNYRIQGSCAELLKMGMILIENDVRLKDLGVKMTLQIHDELLFEIPKGVVKEASAIITEYVSHPYRVMGFKDLLVDPPADMGVGQNWAEAKK
jgi:DNA polymerase-1